MTFDVDKARKQFPALQNQKQVFFDNAGGSQTLGTVIDSISSYLSNTNVQLGASYTVGQESTRRYSGGCQAAAEYVNASPDEVVLGPSTTQFFRNLSFALKFQPGDEIVLSKLDHEANIAPWVDIAERLGLVVKWWSPTPSRNPVLRAKELGKLMGPKTKLVCCTHTSNILGTIHDIASIARVVHETPGAMLCVDGVAFAPHRRIDVKTLGVDFYSFSWYKVYGPHVAMLYASRKAQESVRGMGHFFNPTGTLENKLGLAAASYELVQSIPRIVEYCSREFMEGVAEHEEKLAAILLEYLKGRSDVRIFGHSETDARVRVPTISFVVQGWSSKDVVETIEKRSDFGFRWGHFYSKRLCDEVLQAGEGGVVRVSMVHYNTEAEIRSFVELFDKLITSSSSKSRL